MSNQSYFGEIGSAMKTLATGLEDYLAGILREEVY